MIHSRDVKVHGEKGAAVAETQAKTNLEEASSVFCLYSLTYYDHLRCVQYDWRSSCNIKEDRCFLPCSCCFAESPYRARFVYDEQI